MQIKKVKGLWRLVRFIPMSPGSEWGNYRVIFPRWWL